MTTAVLFCTEHVWTRFGSEITAAAGEIEVVQFVGDQQVSADDLQRITIAFFSGDSWPADTAAFIRCCLKAPNLQWLHTFSAGVDSPVFGTFVNRGIRLTKSSGSSARPIAQIVAWMMIGLSRDAGAWTRAQQAHRWEPRLQEELDGTNLAVIGMGPIGEEAARLGIAFGMNVRGCRRTVSGSEPCATVTFAELDELVRWADFVVLALPLTPSTAGLFGADRLALMKPTARLINVGRGGLVDESALVDALVAGRLGGAGLDVFAVEPLPPESPLWDLPHVIITPHNSSDTSRSNDRAAAMFIENVGRFRTNSALLDEVFADQVGGTEPPR